MLLSDFGGIDVLTGSTDVHLVMLRSTRVALGRQAGGSALGVDRSHGEPQRGGVRSSPAVAHQRPADGTAALATRGLHRGHFVEVGTIIPGALWADGFERRQSEFAERVSKIVDRYRLRGRLRTPALV